MLDHILSIVLFFSEVDERATALGAVIHATAPHISQEKAYEHAFYAMMAETRQVPAELLLSMAYVESRYIPEATSRLTSGKRTTGIPRWKNPPRSVSGPYFCGVTQVAAGKSWKRCLALRVLPVSYKTAVHELTAWIKMCRRIKKPGMRCALAGYGGGFPAIEKGTTTYPARVLGRAKRIRKLFIKKTTTSPVVWRV